MAITFLASEVGGSLDTNMVQLPAINATGATMIAVVTSSYEAMANPVITDTEGNVGWQGLTAKATTGSGKCRLYYHENPVVSAVYQPTITITGGYPAGVVLAFAGTVTSLVFDLEIGATFAATVSAQPGLLEPSDDNYVVINGIAWQSTNTMLIDGLSPVEQIDFNSGLSFGVAADYTIQTTKAPMNPIWAFTNGTGGCVQASFKVGTGGPPPTTTTRNLMLLGIG